MNDPLYDSEVLRKLCARMPKIDFRVHPKPPTKAELDRQAAMMAAMQHDSRIVVTHGLVNSLQGSPYFGGGSGGDYVDYSALLGPRRDPPHPSYL